MDFFLAATVMGALALSLHRLKFERVTLLIALAACALYYVHMYLIPLDRFSLDSVRHVAYVDYVAKHHAAPPPDVGEAFRQPPLYYFAAAAFDSIASARHAGMMFYLAFVVFSLLILRWFLPEKSAAFKAAALLFCFWPVGVTMGARITNDTLLYAAQAGLLYAGLRWLHDTKMTSWLSAAFVAAGFGVLAKNGGIPALSLPFGLLLYAAWLHRQSLRTLLKPHLGLAIAFALYATWSTVTRAWLFEGMAEPGAIPAEWQAWRTIFWFDPWLFLGESFINPYGAASESLFWHWFLRTLVLGQFIEWKAIAVVGAMGVLYFALLAYTLISLLAAFHWKLTPPLCFMLLFWGVLLTPMLYLRMSYGNPAFGDARYAFPTLTLLLLGFGYSLHSHALAGRQLAVSLGRGLAVAWLLCSALLFIALYVPVAIPGA